MRKSKLTNPKYRELEKNLQKLVSSRKIQRRIEVERERMELSKELTDQHLPKIIIPNPETEFSAKRSSFEKVEENCDPPRTHQNLNFNMFWPPNWFSWNPSGFNQPMYPSMSHYYYMLQMQNQNGMMPYNHHS